MLLLFVWLLFTLLCFNRLFCNYVLVLVRYMSLLVYCLLFVCYSCYSSLCFSVQGGLVVCGCSLLWLLSFCVLCYLCCCYCSISCLMDLVLQGPGRLSLFVYVYNICVCVCVCMGVCIYMYVCVYIHIYVYTHVYIHIYIYTYTYICTHILCIRSFVAVRCLL